MYGEYEIKTTKSKKEAKKERQETYDDSIAFAIDDVLHYIGPSNEDLF